MKSQHKILSLLVTYIKISVLIQRSESIYASNVEESSTSSTTIPPLKPSDFPTVHKCCPFNQYWKNGKCVIKNTGDNFGYMNITFAQDKNEQLSFIGFNLASASMEGLVYRTSADFDLESDDDFGNYTVNKSGQQKDIDANGTIVFKLGVSMPKCSSTRKLMKKLIHKEVYMDSNDSETNQSEPRLQPSVFLSTEGWLLVKDAEGFMHIYLYENFCIDQINETTFIALICQPKCDDSEPCIRKCCRPDEILDIGSSTCIKSQKPWNHNLYTPTYEPAPKITSTPNYVYGVPQCDTYPFFPGAHEDDKMYILTNGSLITTSRGSKTFYSSNVFCVDGFVENAPEPAYHSGSELDQLAVICFAEPEHQLNEEEWRYKLNANLELVSSAFLVLTALVYLILWEYQNIHGWLQFAYVGSCFFSFTFLAIVQLYTDEIYYFSRDLCESMGTLIHFWFLSAFFWLTSMNFDLWWTFSGCHPLRPSSKTGDKKRFCIFAIFSWGIPGVIAGLGFILDYIYKAHPNSDIISPRFGEKKCYFRGHKEQLPYFYGPVGFLLFVDLLFFIHTVYSLQKLHKDTKFATRQSSKQDKKKFVLFMKIFIVMGVLWIFEVVGWVFEVYNSNKTVQNVFIPFDVINSLQGLWIFIIFTCKPNTCRQLENKFKKLTLFMEHHRDEERDHTSSVLSRVFACLKITFCTITLPFIHLLRKIFSTCGRSTRSLDSRRATSNTTTVTINNTLDKSRKFSDCSTATTYSTSEPGSLEMDSGIKIISSNNPL